jgi:hypothetical protein
VRELASNFWVAVKAVTAAQLALASDGVYSVTLDEAIEAMRVTAADMSVSFSFSRPLSYSRVRRLDQIQGDLVVRESIFPKHITRPCLIAYLSDRAWL